MPQQSILDVSYQSFVDYVGSIGERSFRAQQVFDWIYKKSVCDFQQMKNLSAGLCHQLKKDFIFPRMECVQKTQDDKTGTIKFLFKLADGRQIETVLIPTAKRMTLCISTQAGCKFACRFCASGIGGWERNLTTGEIVMQILHVQAYTQEQQGKKISHVVFMGMGEPLDNWDAVRDAILIINADEGFNIAARRITISTCGIVPKFEDVAALGKQIELAVSLHGHNDKVREQLMPINKKYPLKDLVSACRDYVKKTNRQITFEYILIDGLTCCDEAPKELGRLLRGLECKLNLIPYNFIKEFDWRAPSRNAIYRFRDALMAHNVHATIRWSKGLGADGACGQLRHTSK